MVEIPQWLHEISADMLPEQHRKIADIVGVEAMLALIATYSGDYLYIPKVDAIAKAARDKSLVADYDKGVDPKELGHKYNLSLAHVYVIIDKVKKGVVPDQIAFNLGS